MLCRINYKEALLCQVRQSVYEEGFAGGSPHLGRGSQGEKGRLLESQNHAEQFKARLKKMGQNHFSAEKQKIKRLCNSDWYDIIDLGKYSAIILGG